MPDNVSADSSKPGKQVTQSDSLTPVCFRNLHEKADMLVAYSTVTST